jgi:hypothetical protein
LVCCVIGALLLGRLQIEPAPPRAKTGGGLHPVNKFERRMNEPISTGSAVRSHNGRNKETTPMFARRFAIVSLMTILFGMTLASIVAHADRPRPWRPGKTVACVFDQGLRCEGHRY